MEFKISRNINNEHIYDIQFSFIPKNNITELQFPVWRPGRYELQNFTKNILKISATDISGIDIPVKKVTKDKWEIKDRRNRVIVNYSYYANKKDAGNSYVDETIFYINFVNCIPYLVGQIDEPVSVEIDFPKDWKYACAMQSKNGRFKAKSFYELYDSPFIASKQIKSTNYFIDQIKFQIDIIGAYNPKWEVLLPNFEKFSQFQISIMGELPSSQYNFIIWILPTAYYHGVEHGSSTMIVLGPDIEGDALNADLLGVASHELFHAWNICKIRPKELLPYDFTQETYFETGFVVEGVTTYLGDLFLLHSGVINKEDYLKELSTTCMRHFVKAGKAAQSLAESSIDLWMDGYSEGIPNKKVSIYHKGALVALLLDLMIRNKFSHQNSLYHVMKIMWEKFGKSNIGYLTSDYKTIAETIYGEPLDYYFTNFIFGNISIEKALNLELKRIGFEILWKNEFTVVVSEIKKPSKIQILNQNTFLTNNKSNAL